MYTTNNTRHFFHYALSFIYVHTKYIQNYVQHCIICREVEEAYVCIIYMKKKEKL